MRGYWKMKIGKRVTSLKERKFIGIGFAKLPKRV